MDRAASTRAATRRAASASDAHAASAAPRVSRGLRIDQYERGQTGVWFYQVDIELRSVYPNREGRTASGFLDACVEEDVQCYAVRRRYNEFLQLYEKIKDELATLTLITGEQCVLPPFPQKEYLSASMLGLLWRTSSSSSVLLEERRAKFETLLCWIETHPVLRYSSSYMDFLGQPPQRSEGYVSLKEYSSQNWLSSLEKLTKEKHKRRLRTSSDCSSCSVLQQEQTRRTKKRRTDDASTPRSSLSEIQKPFKRQRRHHESKMPRTKSLAKLRKMKRTSSSLSEQVDTTSRPDAEESSLQIVEPAWTAHVESSPIHKKKKVV